VALVAGIVTHRRLALQVLGTVGEPINPEAWRWYHETVGEARCPVVDTWWQTETGGHMITPLPGAWAEKPGSCTLPFFGAAPVLLDPETGKELEGVAEGVLCFKQVYAAPAWLLSGSGALSCEDITLYAFKQVRTIVALRMAAQRATAAQSAPLARAPSTRLASRRRRTCLLPVSASALLRWSAAASCRHLTAGARAGVAINDPGRVR
jgi:AMP-binding enzyme